MLNPNAQKLVEALRSEKFKQGRGRLCRVAPEGASYYCCLGVACEIYQREVGGLQVELSDGSLRQAFYDGRGDTPPDVVVGWLGLSDCFGSMGTAELSLVCANDSLGLTFSQIADLIESEPEGLFVKQEVVG